MNTDEYIDAVNKERAYIPEKNLPLFDDMIQRFYLAFQEPHKYTPHLADDMWFYVQQLKKPQTRYIYPILPRFRREKSHLHLARCQAVVLGQPEGENDADH